MNDIYKHKNLTNKIINGFYSVYNELGFGFLESVYDKAMVIALSENELDVESQVEIDVFFREYNVGIFRAYLIVNDCILVELKAVKQIQDIHKAQILNYLKATKFEIGLLLNFGQKPKVKRYIFDEERKKC
ncbi:MAG TPA: GxxExxY protein [bacterium]|nr:GxxExxY protein [bacterium]